MFNASNLLSLARAPLALLFLVKKPVFRLICVVLAMISDGLDGYIARRYSMTSQLGATLDPIMDKFFVLFVSCILLSESSLQAWNVLALLSRDFAVLVFGLYLVLTGRLGRYQFQAIWTGKVTTAFQFFVLAGLSLGYSFPAWVFASFVGLGFIALLELVVAHRFSAPDHNRQRLHPE